MSNPPPATTSHGHGSADQDQHHIAHEDKKEAEASGERFHEGHTAHAHDLHDTTDQRSIKNQIAAAAAAEKEEKRKEAEPKPLPTEAAKSHGNEPSRGAKIDEQLELEEQKLIAKMDAK